MRPHESNGGVVVVGSDVVVVSDGRTSRESRLPPHHNLDDYSSSDGEDDVFIPSSGGGDVISGLATKVLLHPRRGKTPSGGYQEIYHAQRLRRLATRAMTLLFVVGGVATFVYIVVLLAQSWREDDPFNRRPGGYGVVSERESQKKTDKQIDAQTDK